jgi:hypothetical protein
VTKGTIGTIANVDAFVSQLKNVPLSRPAMVLNCNSIGTKKNASVGACPVSLLLLRANTGIVPTASIVSDHRATKTNVISRHRFGTV